MSMHDLLNYDPSLMMGVISTLPVGVFTADNEGLLLSTNPKLLEILGMDLVPTRGLKVHDLPMFKAYGVDRLMAKVVETRESQVEEYRYILPSGNTKRIQFRCSVLRGSDPTVRGVIGILTDLDEVDKLEESVKTYSDELERANQELRAMDEHKNRFLANVSHELRTPLVTLLGYLELTVAGKLGTMAPQVNKSLTIALSQGQRLKKQIEELLNFSARSAYPHIVMTALRPSESLYAAMQTIRSLARKKGIKLTGTKNPPLVMADGDKLSQVFIILLDNAVKFVPNDGEISVSIGPHPEGENSEVLFSIDDNGPGIPEEQRERIFTRFFQVDSSATREHSGMGLGLSMAREAVEAMGGQIWVEDSHLGGARICFTLPGRSGDGDYGDDWAGGAPGAEEY